MPFEGNSRYLQRGKQKSREAHTAHQKVLSDLNDQKNTIRCKKIVIQTLSRKREDTQGQLQTKKNLIQKNQGTTETLKGNIERLQHQVKLYQIMEKVRLAEVTVKTYQVVLVRVRQKQEHTWVQAYSFVCRLSQHYLIPLISTILHASAQLPWLNRFLVPVMRRSLTQLTIWVSPPATAFSQDGLRNLMDKLRKTEARLHVLEETGPHFWKPSVRDKEAEPQDMHRDQEEQTADSCSVNDYLFQSVNELHLPQISRLIQKAEKSLRLEGEKHMRTQALLTGDENDHLGLSQQIQEILCSIAHEDGQLNQNIQQGELLSKKAHQLMQQHKGLPLYQETSMTERANVGRRRALETFWLEQLQDTATQKGSFITYCRARHIGSLNALIAQVLNELNQDTEGIATQRLDFQLHPDYTLKPIHGAPSMGKRSKGQKTRTYLALFLAMFQQTRSRLPFRTSFVFLDEVMDTLDLHGIEALQRWLQRYVAPRGMRAF